MGPVPLRSAARSRSLLHHGATHRDRVGANGRVAHAPDPDRVSGFGLTGTNSVGVFAMALISTSNRPDPIVRFLEHCHRRTYPAKTVIINAGDHSDELYYLIRGSVSVLIEDDDGHEIVLAYLNQGDFFGEMCLLDLEPRCATVVAVEAGTLWEINRDDLYWLFGDDKELQLRILLTVGRVLSRRLARMDAAAARGPGRG